MDLDFEWDESKRKSNIEKHGIGFYDAARMLANEAYFTQPDPRPDQGEMRWRAIGPLPKEVCPNHWSGNLVVVVFTKRDGRFRIISARRASTHERRTYRRQRLRAGPP